MSLTKLTKEVDNISALSDYPNSTEGLTSQELKERFDQASVDIKDYINTTLTDELDTIHANYEETLATKAEVDYDYLKKIDAEQTYETIENVSDYKDEVDETYLKKTDAGDIYLSQEDASENYLTKTEASTTYDTISNVANIYATKQALAEAQMGAIVDQSVTKQKLSLDVQATLDNAEENIDKLVEDVSDIVDLIPSEASVSNNLADKEWVNERVQENTANFIGRFDSIEELEAYSGDLTNNDYAYVVTQEVGGNEKIVRYRYVANTTSWEEEFDMNNTIFTQSQLDTINSGLDADDKTKIGNIDLIDKYNKVDGVYIGNDTANYTLDCLNNDNLNDNQIINVEFNNSVKSPDNFLGISGGSTFSYPSIYYSSSNIHCLKLKSNNVLVYGNASDPYPLSLALCDDGGNEIFNKSISSGYLGAQAIEFKNGNILITGSSSDSNANIHYSVLQQNGTFKYNNVSDNTLAYATYGIRFVKTNDDKIYLISNNNTNTQSEFFKFDENGNFISKETKNFSVYNIKKSNNGDYYYAISRRYLKNNEYYFSISKIYTNGNTEYHEVNFGNNNYPSNSPDIIEESNGNFAVYDTSGNYPKIFIINSNYSVLKYKTLYNTSSSLNYFGFDNGEKLIFMCINNHSYLLTFNSDYDINTITSPYTSYIKSRYLYSTLIYKLNDNNYIVISNSKDNSNKIWWTQTDKEFSSVIKSGELQGNTSDIISTPNNDEYKLEVDDNGEWYFGTYSYFYEGKIEFGATQTNKINNILLETGKINAGEKRSFIYDEINNKFIEEKQNFKLYDITLTNDVNSINLKNFYDSIKDYKLYRIFISNVNGIGSSSNGYSSIFNVALFRTNSSYLKTIIGYIYKIGDKLFTLGNIINSSVNGEHFVYGECGTLNGSYFNLSGAFKTGTKIVIEEV